MKTTTQIIIFVAAIGLATGCKSEIDGKTAAIVSEPATTNAATTGSTKDDAADGRVPLDLVNTKVEWTAAKVTRDHPGGFKDVGGTVSFADGQLASVQVTIQTASVFTDSEKLARHLKEPDFLDVTAFPTATFKSTRIEHGTDGAVVVTGMLDLHGVTREISFPASTREDGANVVATAEFTLMRFDFGIQYKGAADDLVKPEVLMKLQIAAPKPAES